MTDDEVPDWAIEEVLKRTEVFNWTVRNTRKDVAGGLGFGRAVMLAAKLIATHEQPPVDPLLLNARQLLADHWEKIGRPLMANEALRGDLDNSCMMTLTLAALRRGMELAQSK